MCTLIEDCFLASFLKIIIMLFSLSFEHAQETGPQDNNAQTVLETTQALPHFAHVDIRAGRAEAIFDKRLALLLKRFFTSPGDATSKKSSQKVWTSCWALCYCYLAKAKCSFYYFYFIFILVHRRWTARFCFIIFSKILANFTTFCI